MENLEGKLFFNSSSGGEEGFTNASTSQTDDKKNRHIIRELVQNSWDSAVEAKQEVAEISFFVKEFNKSDIVGLEDYEAKFSRIEKTKQKGKNKDFYEQIENELKKECFEVLFVKDNGVGFDKKKMIAVLGNGCNEKKDENASGSYGNGHFSAFNASNLRYVLYYGKSKQDGEIFSAHAILASSKEENENGKPELKSANGFFLKKENLPIIEEYSEEIFVKNMPKMFESVVNVGGDGKYDETLAVVGIVDFNYFSEYEFKNEKEKFEYLKNTIFCICASNFFIPITEKRLIVSVESDSQEKQILNSTHLHSFIQKNQNELQNTSLYYQTLFHEKISLNNADIWLKKDTNETKVAIFRNSMFITDSCRIGGLTKNTYSEFKPFCLLILPKKNLETLIKKAEGNLHNDIQKSRLSKADQKSLEKELETLQKEIKSRLDKNDLEKFDLKIDGFSIDLNNKHKQNKTIKETKEKIPTITGSEGNEMSLEQRQESGKNSGKKRALKASNLTNFSSFLKNGTLQICFVMPKECLILRLLAQDGTDLSCDRYTHLEDGVEVKKFKSTNCDCEQIDKNTLKIKAPKDIEVTLELFGNFGGCIDFRCD